MSDNINDLHLSQFKEAIRETQESSLESDQARKANQIDANQDSLTDALERYTPAWVEKRSRSLSPSKEKKVKKVKVEESVLVRKEDADGLAKDFCGREGNKDYHLIYSLLRALAEQIGVGIRENSAEDSIIDLVQHELTVDNARPDVAIVDKALEFLVEFSGNQAKKETGDVQKRFLAIQKKLESAKQKHFIANRRNIETANKIIGAVDAAIQETGQTVNEGLDRYRDMVHNRPSSIHEMMKKYSGKPYVFLEKELKGLNSYLGKGFKGESLERGEISQLIAATRLMQAIFSIYRLTENQMRIIEKYLQLHIDLAA